MSVADAFARDDEHTRRAFRDEVLRAMAAQHAAAREPRPVEWFEVVAMSAVVAALDAAPTRVERCAPESGTCWWWRLTDYERRVRGIRGRRARQPAGGGAPAADGGRGHAGEPERAPHAHPDADRRPGPGDAAPGAGRGLAHPDPASDGAAAEPGADAGAHDSAPAPVHDAPPTPSLADRALRLLERRAEQGLGGAQVSWLAWQLGDGVLKAEVQEIVEHDPRFDRIAVGTDVWWWPAAALAQRNQHPERRRS